MLDTITIIIDGVIVVKNQPAEEGVKYHVELSPISINHKDLKNEH